MKKVFLHNDDTFDQKLLRVALNFHYWIVNINCFVPPSNLQMFYSEGDQRKFDI